MIVQVSRTTFLPVLAGPGDPEVSAAHLTEDFVGDLTVGYTTGPVFGQSLLTWEDLDRLGLVRPQLRREAAANLYQALDGVGIHGQPPALMLSFDGLESSVLLAHRFWDELEDSVPGELVVGVPARDVVIFTGTWSHSGMQRVRRAVDRMFFAGGAHLLSRDLLVRRQRRWEVLEQEEPPPWESPVPLRSGAIPAGLPAPDLLGRPVSAPVPIPVSPPVPQPRMPLSTARAR